MPILASHSPRDLLTRFAAVIRHQYEMRAVRSAERKEFGRVAHELSFASDRDLAELGYSRADIAEISRGTYRR